LGIFTGDQRMSGSPRVLQGKYSAFSAGNLVAFRKNGAADQLLMVVFVAPPDERLGISARADGAKIVQAQPFELE